MEINLSLPEKNWKPEYNELVKKLVACKNLFQLRDTIKEINAFISKNQIRDNTKEFKKLSDLVSLMRIKLKNEFRIKNESVRKRVIRLTESELTNLIKKVISELN